MEGKTLCTRPHKVLEAVTIESSLASTANQLFRGNAFLPTFFSPGAYHVELYKIETPQKIYFIANRLTRLMAFPNVSSHEAKKNSWNKHYLMGLGPNPKKIPQNSGKKNWIPEGMQFNSLLSIKSQNVGPWRKINKPLFPRWIYYISSNFWQHKSKNLIS